MENMDKGLTVPKWVLINQPKIPEIPQTLSDQIVCPSPKVWDFNEKGHHWASVVRGRKQWDKKNYEVALENFFILSISRDIFESFILAINMCLYKRFVKS